MKTYGTRNTGHTGEKWFTCARSGWDFPVSERVYQNGLPIARRFADDETDRETDPRNRITFTDPPT